MEKLDLLYRHCADEGVDVEHGDLGTRHGQYHHGLRLIILNIRLTAAQATTALAHEVGHLVHGDRCSSPAVERRADETGASLIITPEEYAAAEQEVGPHPGALAALLGVTPRLIHAWRRWYRRRAA